MPVCGSVVPVSSWSLLIRGNLRRPQAENPLIPLSRFPGPALTSCFSCRQLTRFCLLGRLSAARRPFQLDAVAVGVGEVDRRPLAVRAEAVDGLAGRDA